MKRSTRIAGLTAALAATALVAGCQRGPQTAADGAGPHRRSGQDHDPAGSALTLEEQPGASSAANRCSPDGRTSLIGLHWVDQGPHFVGSGGDNGIRLAMGPEHFGMIDLRKDGSVHFVPGRTPRSRLTDSRRRARPRQAPTHPDGLERDRFRRRLKGVAIRSSVATATACA